MLRHALSLLMYAIRHACRRLLRLRHAAIDAMPADSAR